MESANDKNKQITENLNQKQKIWILEQKLVFASIFSRTLTLKNPHMRL